MKTLLRPIWNYLIGYRNGYCPKILWEHVPQCPLKFWCSVLWVYKKNNTKFDIAYIDEIVNEEITYEQYMDEYNEFTKLKNEWYKKEYDKRHTKTEKRIHKIHYWLNDVNSYIP